MIPFEAFPPLSATDLSDLRLLVDVFNSTGAGKESRGVFDLIRSACSGRPETFNRLRFDPPQQFHLTPCDLAARLER